MQQYQEDNEKLKYENEQLDNQVRYLKRKSTHTKFVELEVEKTQLILHCQQQQQMIEKLVNNNTQPNT